VSEEEQDAEDRKASEGKGSQLRTKVDSDTEQVFFNDVLGLPYEIATDAPDWEELRDRTENAEPGERLVRGMLPATGFLFTVGVDCQDDRTEVHFVAFGRNRRRWVIDYQVIPHHISDDECRATLNGYLKQEWRTELGLRIPIDMLAIDGGTYTDDVWSWAKTHPWTRVIIVKGASTQNGPLLLPQKFERRRDGKAKRRQKRAFMLNVSQLKGGFYTHVRKEHPEERGYTQFPPGLGDEYYRQIASETRVLTRSKTGVVSAKWELVEPGRRNEGLATMNYAEAAALRKGWASMSDAQWDTLEAERSKQPKENQGDLFDQLLPVVPAQADATKTSGEESKKRSLSDILSELNK
jgi:phage terminase large subunit GpA-like protein